MDGDPDTDEAEAVSIDRQLANEIMAALNPDGLEKICDLDTVRVKIETTNKKGQKSTTMDLVLQAPNDGELTHLRIHIYPKQVI